MLPVALALSGSGPSTVSVGFIGWFGPRGPASMVLGRVYLEHAVGAVHPTIHLAVMATVLLSILAYGLSAGPAAARYGRHVASLPATAAERVGADNFFLFGLTADEVFAVKSRGHDPREALANAELRAVIEAIGSGRFSNGDTQLFQPLVDSLLRHDEYLLLTDYASYVECSERAAQAYRDEDAWTRMSILNCARCGFFSSDRAMRQYSDEIWRVRPVAVE